MRVRFLFENDMNIIKIKNETKNPNSNKRIKKPDDIPLQCSSVKYKQILLIPCPNKSLNKDALYNVSTVNAFRSKRSTSEVLSRKNIFITSKLISSQ